MLQLARPDSLVDRVVAAIRAEISSGRLSADSRLPTEHQLSEQLNVSRSVVREAVSQLKADGILVSQRGNGSFISRTPTGTVFRLPGTSRGATDLAQLFEMRLWIEIQAASVAAARRNAADLLKMRNALEVMQEHPNDFTKSSAADVDFHQAIVAACKNDYFMAFHDFLGGQLAQGRLVAWQNSARLPGGARPASNEHAMMYQAIEAGESQAAADCARAHLESAALRFGIKLG
ncbi:FadR/GntR family transcriptional regulator [Pseudomonas putida]|uniref:FadR/GntR family transcriptional regulator n=1 Tax=Pseudomonas putida TaxID=303 RepID=UPI001E33D96E|nr:FadR/GntR family transcriptional regulator [Pseudomonas putida]MCE0883256.1 FadR family transcriptional regulator [Pseudomonas putida]